MMTGADFVEFANKYEGQQYILGAFAPKDNPNWRGPWDCAEFASWLTFQSVGLLLGCTNNNDQPARADAYSGAWARDCTAAQRPLTIGQARATAGAILVRKPGAGGIGHVAISRGDGTTIEAHSAKEGVCSKKVDGRRWDLAMLLPLVVYPSEIAVDVFSPPAEIVVKLMFPPMHGELIKNIQEMLAAKKIDPGDVDGVYGPHTAAAVRAFQLREGLVPDGEVGSQTLEALRQS